MQSSIIVEGKVFGQKRPLFADWHVPLPPDPDDAGGQLTLRGLITRIVLEEVSAFTNRQEDRRMVRALTQADIERGLMKGKVQSGGSEIEQPVDANDAVSTALLAFEDGLYYVFIDEEQQLALDAPVYLKPESRMTFLRLVALAGG